MNLVNWFEIPTTDLKRAAKFYETILDLEINIQNFDSVEMGWFPYDPSKTGAGGTLIKYDEYRPSSTHGPLLYLSCEDVADITPKIAPAGGKVMLKKTLISEDHGYYALFLDTEGNRMALHSNK